MAAERLTWTSQVHIKSVMENNRPVLCTSHTLHLSAATLVSLRHCAGKERTYLHGSKSKLAQPWPEGKEIQQALKVIIAPWLKRRQQSVTTCWARLGPLQFKLASLLGSGRHLQYHDQARPDGHVIQACKAIMTFRDCLHEESF